jgi:hypothetical protein
MNARERVRFEQINRVGEKKQDKETRRSPIRKEVP